MRGLMKPPATALAILIECANDSANVEIGKRGFEESTGRSCGSTEWSEVEVGIDWACSMLDAFATERLDKDCAPVDGEETTFGVTTGEGWKIGKE